MHVLIITSEELNETNKYPSVFELAQAKALQEATVRTGIISLGVISSKAIVKSVLFKLIGKKNNYSRTKDLSLVELAGLFFSNFFKSVTHTSSSRRLLIEGVKVFECAIATNGHFSFRNDPKSKWINQAMKTVECYFRENGKPDLIHAHNRFLIAGQLAMEVKRKYGIPYILTDHSSFYVRKMVKEEEKPEVIAVIENADLFTTVSRKLAEWINSELKTSFRSEVIPNALDEEFEYPIPAVRRRKNKFVFLSVASLDENKGHKFLIESFKLASSREKNVELRIAGEGPLLDELKDLVNKEGLSDKVIFLGQISHLHVRDQMLDSDCLVVSSGYETFGVVVIESLACGKPVISTKCGGPEDLVNETNGKLVSVGDRAEMANAMVEVKVNYQKYEGAELRSDCIEKYGTKAIARKLIGTYQTVLQSNRHAHPVNL